MSSTNKTANYNLSQFIGSDKPAWLQDYNTDMSRIDTGIKNAADAATVADGKADNNSTAIGTLANLTTTAKTDLVSSINEVDSAATTAQNTANSASNVASTAATNIAKFNLTERSTLTPSVNKGTIRSEESLTNLQFATDTSNSVFKVYGRMNVESLTGLSGTFVITLGQTSLRPSSGYTINTGAIMYRHYANGNSDTVPRNLDVATDGTISITDTTTLGGVDFVTIMVPPCLYFNSDFGDE